MAKPRCSSTYKGSRCALERGHAGTHIGNEFGMAWETNMEHSRAKNDPKNVTPTHQELSERAESERHGLAQTVEEEPNEERLKDARARVRERRLGEPAKRNVPPTVKHSTAPVEVERRQPERPVGGPELSARRHFIFKRRGYTNVTASKPSKVERN